MEKQKVNYEPFSEFKDEAKLDFSMPFKLYGIRFSSTAEVEKTKQVFAQVRQEWESDPPQPLELILNEELALQSA